MDCKLITPCGPVLGLEEDGIRIFRGVPYAETKRFQKPVLIDHWEGLLDATGQETDCFQYSAFRDEAAEPDNFYYQEFRGNYHTTFGESPQRMNIVTPEAPSACPVLVFIHGGGHETGTIGEPPYGLCSEYARRGILFVSVGYRLNVFSLYECGNYGLHDQIAAVKWLRKNIAAFGGDPDRITLIGQSAGAMSITDLCYSQTLKGDIQGAVLMSGGGAVPRFAGPFRKDQAAPFWEKVRSRAGAKTEADMGSLPAQTIWEAWYRESRAQNNLHLLQPGIDGEIIPDVPQNVLRRGEDLDIPILIGVTSQDYLPVLLYEMALRWGLRNEKRGRSKVYGYFFDRTLPGNRYKAFHAADLWYVFGNMEASWRPFEPSDYRLSAQMIDSICAFVKTGSPNGPGLPDWPPLGRRQKGFRLFDGQSSGLIFPRTCRKKVLHTMLKDPGPM